MSSDQNMAARLLKVSVILGVVCHLQSGVLGITCLDCENKNHLRECEGFKVCPPGETCFIQSQLDLGASTNGLAITYTAGCRKIQECNLVQCAEELTTVAPAPKRQASGPVPICSECCYNDTCNTKGCGATFREDDDTQPQPYCFDCHYKHDNTTCETFKRCELNEICVTTRKSSPVQGDPDTIYPYYKLRCIKEQICDLLGAATGGNQAASTCCKTDFCNSNPLSTPDELSVVEPTACPTGLVKPTTTTTTKSTPTTITTKSTPSTATTMPTSPPTTATTTTTMPTPPPTTATPTTTTTMPTPPPTTATPTTTTTMPTPPPTTATPTTTTTMPTPPPTTATPTTTMSTPPTPVTATPTTPTTNSFTTRPSPTPTTPTTTTSTTTKPTTTTVATTTPTTPRPPKTIGNQPTLCYECTDPVDFCEILYVPKTCEAPNNYCINYVSNQASGERTVNRTCGNFNTCFNDWYQGSSDNERCQKFDGQVQTLNFECTYCCINDYCNVDLHPATDTLYADV